MQASLLSTVSSATSARMDLLLAAVVRARILGSEALCKTECLN